MSYDDIVIGSGLTALGTVLGFPAARRILVLGGPADGRLSYYGGDRGVPNAYLGFGGLGRYWHGVIPTGLRPNPDKIDAADFAALFGHFYPETDIRPKLERPWLFVPKRPIRTPVAWSQLQRERGTRLEIRHEVALDFAQDRHSATVRTKVDAASAERVWIAAGTLHTPQLLAASLPGFDGVRRTLSDHVIAYMGQVDREQHPQVPNPRVERSRDGFWVPATFNPSGRGLFTLKPARFSYRRLDHGIEQRAAFGLPTGGVIAKLVRAASLGLIAEALYNKLGLFPDARLLSVYAQILVPDAYALAGGANLAVRAEAIRAAVDAVREDPAWPDLLIPSSRPELFINGIHLHHSVDRTSLEQRGVNIPQSRVTVVDASIADDIGSEHHSFKLMAAAYAKARKS